MSPRLKVSRQDDPDFQEALAQYERLGRPCSAEEPTAYVPPPGYESWWKNGTTIPELDPLPS